MVNKTCRVHYRRLDREASKFQAGTLSDRLSAGLNAQSADGTLIRAKVENRIAPVPNNAGHQRALNNYEIGQDFVFGTTCLFAPGQMQAFLKLIGEEDQADLADVLEAYEIAEAAAPKGHEYLHGLTYWLAVQDHFYQIQHVSLQSGAMEQYLTWLLRDQAKVLTADQCVQLQSVFDQAQLGDDEPTFIQVGGIVPETLRDDPMPAVAGPDPIMVDVEERERVGGTLLGWAKGKQILEEIYGALKAQELLDAVPDEASLEVSVNIGYRAKKRRLQKAFMKDLAAGLRNLPDGEVTIRTKGGTSKGPDARLFLDMPVAKISNSSGLLKIDHARDQMLEVHKRFLHDGKIEP